jgi:hypothetical protein
MLAADRCGTSPMRAPECRPLSEPESAARATGRLQPRRRLPDILFIDRDAGYTGFMADSLGYPP